MTTGTLLSLIPTWVDGRLQPVGKLEAHERALRHKAVSVFVMRDGKLLLQQRALGKYHTPGLWANTCCTHPHWEEAPEACAMRRLNEELGITGLELTPRGQIEYRADVGGGLVEHELVDVFLADVVGEIPLAPNPDEVMATDWIDLDALTTRLNDTPENFVPWLKIYLDQHRAQIFGG